MKKNSHSENIQIFSSLSAPEPGLNTESFPHGARILTVVHLSNGPSTGRETTLRSTQHLPIDPIKYTVIPRELPSERCFALDYLVKIFHRQGAGVLFRWVVPGDVVEVVADGGVPEFIGIADYGVEIVVWRGDKVRIVHQKGSRKVFPSPYAIFEKGNELI